MDPSDSPDDIPPRDVAILKVRVENPTASTRELSVVLEEKYDISLSHNRINEILREMANSGVFRETIIPNRTIFSHYLFRMAFHYPNFADHWKDCHEDLVGDPHTMMFFNADSTFHWHVIMQFRSDGQMERWVHEFFKAHGDLLDQFDITKLHQVHKFGTEAEIFDDILLETEEGREFLRRADEGGGPGATDRPRVQGMGDGEE